MSSVRLRILNGAVSALRENPRASLDDVASAAGVGRATVYRHFGSRSQLLDELGDVSMSATEDVMADIDRRGLRGLAALLALLDEADIGSDWASFVTNFSWSDFDPAARERYEKTLVTVAGWVDEARAAGDISMDLPTSWVVSVHSALTYAAWEGVASGDLAPNAVNHLLRETFLAGVGAR